MMYPWFQVSRQFHCFLTDLIMGEISALRQGLPTPALYDAEINFGEDGLGLDSLEIMALSSALSRTIHFHESQIDENMLNNATFSHWQSIALQSLTIFSERISFKSSGSAGLAKYHTHSLTQLEEEAAYLGQQFAGRQRILRAVPSHHIYGFIFSVLLPRYLGAEIEVIDIRGTSSNALISKMRAGDVIIGYPEFWQYLDHCDLKFPTDIVGVNSSGPCRTQVGLNLLTNGLSSLVEVYGASETAGIGLRTHPLSPYTLFPYWKKSENDHSLQKVLADFNSMEYKLQDNLQWSSPTQFVINGRLDDMVQVGGINVSLNTVQEKLLQHPWIQDAAVRLMRPEEGSRLKAFIVLNTNAIHLDSTHPSNNLNYESIAQALQQYIHDNLKTAEQPKSLKFGQAIPMNKIGKKSDWSV